MSTMPSHAADRASDPGHSGTAIEFTSVTRRGDAKAPAAIHRFPAEDTQRVHENLIQRMRLERISNLQPEDRTEVTKAIREIIDRLGLPYSGIERDQLAEQVLQEVYGLGPLQPLIEDDTVNDILINTHTTVYVERKGRLEETTVQFYSREHLMHIVERIVTGVGRRIDEAQPMVDARLADGSRVNIIIPPLAIDGPIVSIRKFGANPLTAEDLIGLKAFTPEMLEFLSAAVKAKLNIIVSGGTGAGKTTLLNVLSRSISSRERIITIEDSAELKLQQKHIVRLECRPRNLEGKGEVRQRELVINALRMRPDRIVLGEVRGDEAIDMLQAMNTGHEGSLTTIHANSPRDAISRLETMVLMGSAQLPEIAIRKQIASAIHIIVQANRLTDGSRRITHVSEICAMNGDVLPMQEIFTFEQSGVDGEGVVHGKFAGRGLRPRLIDKIERAGIHLSKDVFEHEMEV